jgi:hypothetical protein
MMTDHASPPSIGRSGWADRLPLPARLALLVIVSLLCVFSIGVIAGAAKAVLEHGVLKPRSFGVLALALGGVALTGWASWKLSAHWRRPEQSRYERRYVRAMLVLALIGLPLGMMLRFFASPNDLLSNAPLAPSVAVLASALLVLLLGLSLVIYHRAIDDFEQQAYLWANSLAFYFIMLALPAAWLLARGGLIPPVGIGSALLILAAALVINASVWAWLKFR